MKVPDQRRSPFGGPVEDHRHAPLAEDAENRRPGHAARPEDGKGVSPDRDVLLQFPDKTEPVRVVPDKTIRLPDNGIDGTDHPGVRRDFIKMGGDPLLVGNGDAGAVQTKGSHPGDDFPRVSQPVCLVGGRKSHGSIGGPVHSRGKAVPYGVAEEGKAHTASF